MFDFFDAHKNPFMAMLNMDDMPDPDQGMDEDMDPMKFMQQAFMMQMKFSQMMLMMPFQMMKNIAEMMGAGAAESDESDKNDEPAGAAQPEGFKLGGREIPPEMLSMLLNMEMSPENLEKLQKTLDFAFSAMPEAKKEKDA